MQNPSNADLEKIFWKLWLVFVMARTFWIGKQATNKITAAIKKTAALFFVCRKFLGKSNYFNAPTSLKYFAAPGWNGTLIPVTAFSTLTSLPLAWACPSSSRFSKSALVIA